MFFAPGTGWLVQAKSVEKNSCAAVLISQGKKVKGLTENDLF